MKSLSVLVPGGTLHTQERGTGPTLLCLHGGPGASHDYLAHGLGRLSGRFRQLHFDQRGGGRSTSFRSREPSFEELLADIDAVCDAYRITTLGMVGHSWGATLALAYALTCKRKLTGLALVNALPLGSDWAQLIYDLILARSASPTVIRRLKQVEVSLASGTSSERENTLDFAHRAVPLLVRTHDWQRLPNYAVRLDWQAEIWAAATLHIARHRRRLPHAAVVIQGEKDAASASSVAEALRSYCHADTATLSSCGHVAPLEAPKRLCEILDDFFSTAPALPMAAPMRPIPATPERRIRSR